MKNITEAKDKQTRPRVRLALNTGFDTTLAVLSSYHDVKCGVELFIERLTVV